MKKQGTGRRRYSRKFTIIIAAAAAALLLFILILAICLSSDSLKKNPVRELENTSDTYTRTVSEEEYQFYYSLAERDMPYDSEQSEIAGKAKEKAEQSAAEFSLGQKMGICQPYSFESLQRNMEKENDQRKIKKENGEAVYGPEKFDLITYFEYVTSNLKLDAVEYITNNADDEMIRCAETYFEEHREDYQPISNIKYTVTENGKTEEENLSREEMRTLERLDGELFDFLYYGKEGDTMDYVYGNAERTVSILSIEKEDPDFSEVQSAALEDYVTEVYYEELVQKEKSHIILEFPE